MSAEQLADRIDTALKEISDVAMPRLKTTGRPSVYWWNEEIADLRVRYVRIRRCILRRRRKYQDTEMVRSLGDGLREAKKLLRNAIRKSKLTLWQGLLETLDADPWGMPYRVVLDKLRRASSLVKSLPPAVVGALFPLEAGDFDLDPSLVGWDEALAVTGEEVSVAVARINVGKAPGPGGISGRLIKDTSIVLARMWTSCFTACLRESVFPAPWKMARLVLLKKPGKPDLAPSSYRPICLLSEAGKLFERIICIRLVRYLDASGIAEPQYGFRSNISTIDAIWRLRSIVDDTMRDGWHWLCHLT